jgi:hypothetical protein
MITSMNEPPNQLRQSEQRISAARKMRVCQAAAMAGSTCRRTCEKETPTGPNALLGSAIDNSEAAVRQYIQEQEKEDQRLDQLEMMVL